MGRRGWSTVATPAGWYEIIRGPRPPSVQCPKGQGKGKIPEVPQVSVVRGGRWRQGVPQHVRQTETVRARRNLDEVRGGRFQQDHQVTVSSGSSWIPPVAEQIEQTQKFIERAKKRVLVAEEYLQWAEEWKVECEKELSEAEERLSRLRFEADRPMAPVPVSVTEVQRLQQQFAEAQAQLHQQGSASVTAGRAKRPRRREDFMRSCAEEVIEWISDRQVDIQEEIAKGNAAEVARLSSLVVQAATSLQPVHTSMVAEFVSAPGTSSGAVTGSSMIQ